MNDHSSQGFQGYPSLVVFDWAGTTVDYGCCAPLVAFTEIFRRHGITITKAQARAPMGLEKRAHIAAIGQMEEVDRQWKQKYGRSMHDGDIDDMFAGFAPLLLEVLGEHSTLIAGVIETVQWLRRSNIKIGATTGYFKEAADVVAQVAASQGFEADYTISATEVAAGRPAPWMIYRVMEALQVYPAQAVVNVGDTRADVEAGLNAGVWTVGVAETGNLCGLSPAEFKRLSVNEAETTVAAAERKLQQVGAHYVIRNMSQLSRVIGAITERLSKGEKP